MPMALRIFLILVFLPIFGFFAGSEYYSWSSSDERIQWEMCTSPPSPAVSFSNSPNGVVVIAKNGATYLLTSCRSDNWIPIDNLPADETEDTFYEFCWEFHPPGINNILDVYEVCSEWGLGYSYDRYVILKDGTVWLWSKMDGGEPLGLFLYPMFGAISFFVLGIFISVIMIVLHLASRFDERIKLNNTSEPKL